MREPTSVSNLPILRLRTQSTALELARGLLDRSASSTGYTASKAIAPLLALKRPGALCGTAVPIATIEQLHRAAEMTLAHLPPDLRRALWIERRWLECSAAKLSPAIARRMDLYAAIAARDAQAMLGLARELLEAGSPAGEQEWRRYLLLTAMLGAHISGEHEEAKRLWQTYRGALYPDGRIPPSVSYVANLK